MTPLLQFDHVSKRFGSVRALDEISLTVVPGSTLALLGPNGAGKSTLFGCLLGFVRPASGTIRYRGAILEPRHRSRIGYVSERVALYPNRTVLENAMFFAELKQAGPGEAQLQLERVRLDGVAGRKVRELSKGMLQRLGLAIALAGKPELLVLDEPFNGLDPVVLDEFTGIIREEQSRGATLLISTHTLSAVEPLASHAAILFEGKLAYHAPAGEWRAAGSLERVYDEVARRNHAALLEEIPA